MDENPETLDAAAKDKLLRVGKRVLVVGAIVAGTLIAYKTAEARFDARNAAIETDPTTPAE